MKVVKQEDYSGCGIACLASVTNSSYRNVKQKMFPLEQKRSFYTYAKDLVQYLNNYSKKTRIIHSTSWNKVMHSKAPKIIAGINRDKNGTWHWIVYDKKNDQLMDPKPQRSDIRKRMKSNRVHVFIEIW